MGLLKLAEQFQEENKSHQPDARRLLDSFNHSSKKIDFPYAVFKLFKTLINFKWGIMLLPNEIERQYFVWGGTGYSPDEVQSFTLSFDQSEIMASAEMLIPFAPVHTNKIPHEIIKGGNLLILGDPGTPTACIYCQSPAKRIAEKEIKTINQHLGREIRESRKFIDHEPKNMTPGNWLDKVKHEKIIILIINIKKAAEHLVKIIPGMHQKVAWNEIAGIIRHLKGKNGYLYNLKDGRVLLLDSQRRIPDHELYMHQLNISCSSAIQLEKYLSCLESRVVEWPKEKNKIVEEFPGLFS